MKTARHWPWIALVLLVAGCSSSSSPTTNNKADTTPPTIASVMAVDQQHVDVEFSEAVNKDSAERSDHYQIETVVVASASPATSTIGIRTVVLDNDGKTAHLTTDAMQAVAYNLIVSMVQDLHGNVIAQNSSSSFTGTTAPDVTPPTIVERSPAPGQTGVGVGQSVMVHFSEGMDYNSVQQAFSWTKNGGGAVSFETSSNDDATFIFTPGSPLELNTQYTVTMGSGAMDWAGNHFAGLSWNFYTTAQADHTPPTLVSSSPANNATNVNVASNVVLTFSEALDQSSLDNVYLFPDLGNGSLSWSNQNRTLTFDPYVDMMTNTQYTLVLEPGALRDLAGNANSEPYTIVWTTGATLLPGGFSGTLSGPNSADASGPGGAVVAAAVGNPFTSSGGVVIGGTAIAASNGNYTVQHLNPGTYYPISVMDSNGDGQLEPDLGDAVGIYGADLATGTGAVDSVTVSNTVITGIDFSLFDPSAIAGHIDYTGSLYQGCCYTLYIGAFDTTGFDPGNPGSPMFGTAANWPSNPDYVLSEFDGNITAGTYYIGAFLDANNNGTLDAGDPATLYGGASTPTPVHVENGTDALHVDITLADVTALVAGGWTATSAHEPSARARAFKRIADSMRSYLR